MTESAEYQIEIEHFVDHYWRKQDASETNQRNFKSSYKSFDEKLGGLETGEVVVVSGHTKNGKTLFVESWLRKMVEKDPYAKSLIFSFEVPTNKLLFKYMDNPQLQIYVPNELKTMDFEWLKEACRKARDEKGCGIVMIDHLHFLVDMNTRQNMSLNIGAFMRRLKQEIAIGLGVAVILIAHQGQAQEGRQASINTIRDSSFVAQEADSVIIVARRKNFDQADKEALKAKYGQNKFLAAMQVEDAGDIEDQYSAGFAIVTIERTRRTGVFEAKKLFQKVGDFLEEV